MGERGLAQHRRLTRSPDHFATRDSQASSQLGLGRRVFLQARESEGASGGEPPRLPWDRGFGPIQADMARSQVPRLPRTQFDAQHLSQPGASPLTDLLSLFLLLSHTFFITHFEQLRSRLSYLFLLFVSMLGSSKDLPC